MWKLKVLTNANKVPVKNFSSKKVEQLKEDNVYNLCYKEKELPFLATNLNNNKPSIDEKNLQTAYCCHKVTNSYPKVLQQDTEIEASAMSMVQNDRWWRKMLLKSCV